MKGRKGGKVKRKKKRKYLCGRRRRNPTLLLEKGDRWKEERRHGGKYGKRSKRKRQAAEGEGIVPAASVGENRGLGHQGHRKSAFLGGGGIHGGRVVTMYRERTVGRRGKVCVDDVTGKDRTLSHGGTEERKIPSSPGTQRGRLPN